MRLNDFQLVESAQEKLLAQTAVNAFNDTQAEYPRNRTVHTLFSEQAARTPDAVAVMDGERCWTYGVLDRQSNRLARLLIGAGQQPEGLVCVLLDRPFEILTAVLAILKAGGAYVPIDDDAPYERMKFILNDTGTRVLITERRWLSWARRLQWECPLLELVFCADSWVVTDATEASGDLMREDIWDAVGQISFDDISGGGWTSSFTGEWLSRRVMDEYGDNIRTKLDPYLHQSTRVLEVGIGSGISMFRLAPMVGYYLGTDLSGEIVRKTATEVERRGLNNIVLRHLPAHEVDRVGERGFDVVVFNKVIDCFAGLDYLRGVLKAVVDLMSDQGVIFLGAVWDLDKKSEFVRSLAEFQKKHSDKGYRTKSDRSDDNFVSREFLDDLRYDLPEIVGYECSRLLATEESELSLFSFDAILKVDKRGATPPPEPRPKRALGLAALDTYPDAGLEERSGPDRLAYVMYTSGTSGRPKGVMVCHRSISRLVINTNYVRFTATDRCLQTGSLAFDASTFEIWGMLLNGGALLRPAALAVLDTAEVARLIRTHGITVLFLTPSLFNQHVESDFSIFAGLKYLVVGGEKASTKHFNIVHRAHPGLTLINGYGPTENTTFTTCHRVETTYNGDIPIGRPISNTEVLILDSNGELASIGVPGEICAAGDGLARGYLHDENLTRERFVAHPFREGQRLYRTGDLGRWRADGTVEFLDRIDEQVKIRGYRIEPREVEAHVLALDGVRQAAVFARDINGLSKELVAIVTGAADLNVDDMRQQLRRVVPEYMVPSYIRQMPKLPLNANGKVDRKVLTAPIEARGTSRKPHEPPATEIERRLLRIWEQVLGHDGIGVTDNFFDSGGHSLKIAKLIALVEKELGVVVPLTTIFKTSTIRQFASLLLDYARFGVDMADQAMVCLSRTDTGPFIFAFPPGTGDAAGFIQVAQRLDPWSFYGFNFIEAESRMRDYADLIESIDPVGPYLFFGYSSGGNLAYHVAEEVERRGRCVTDILMIDSARKMAKVPFSDAEVRKVADDFLAHESNSPYLTSTVLLEKAYRLIERSFAYHAQAVDVHVIDANIHVLNSESGVDSVCDASGLVLASKSGWAGVTRRTYRSYPGHGDHNHMLYEPALDLNLGTIRRILETAAVSTGLAGAEAIR
jgi:amino acid adenylation domain-containing protein